MLKMLRLAKFILFCLALTLGWASPIGIVFFFFKSYEVVT